ncbi:DNA-binding protein inhibitor ID-4 [Ixodes scapularis]|uniref:DNA-binding protein inhibitor ID-4 n=1 Tax=Ixodes scapularis TaxID=6945 RepID=UPI001A9D9EAD|nr:DNA-binding protein inhibitor ID-4 [Ixodes scapularis]
MFRSSLAVESTTLIRRFGVVKQPSAVFNLLQCAVGPLWITSSDSAISRIKPGMKSQMEQQVISRCLAKVAEGRVGRGRKDRDLNHEEMQSLLAKLKELVPNMPRNKKLSKLEIIQNVIDYILDLQIALETHPATRSSHPAGSSTSPARQPLGVLSPSSNAVANTCSVLEANHADKVLPSHLTDLISAVVPSPRPVSC